MSDETTQTEQPAGGDTATQTQASDTATTPDLSAQLAAERARSAGYEAQIAELREQAAAAEAARSEATKLRESLDLARVGLADDEAIDVARLYYGRIPEADRPAGGIAEWAKGLRAEGATVPKALQPWFAPPAQQQAAPAVRPVPAAGSAGGGGGGGAGGAVSAEALRALREEAQRTRDWSKWEAAAKGPTGRRA